MIDNMGMYQGYSVEGSAELKVTPDKKGVEGSSCSMQEMCAPIYECPEERVCHRYICHEVPHIKPCNTRIINHHVYRHTFTPCYTCCEENEFSNVYENNNCCF